MQENERDKRIVQQTVHEKERNEDGRYTIRVTFFFLSLINLRKYYALHEIKCLLMFI